jgi:hypothetical protein
MDQTGITETILYDTITRFESSDRSNGLVANLLRNGIQEGQLQDSEWIANILIDTEDSTLPKESPNEAPES